MTAPPATLGLCIVHWNTDRELKVVLEGLSASRDVEVDIVVVDNASLRESAAAARELAAEFGAAFLSLQTNCGYAGGANRGLTQLLSSKKGYEYLAVCAHDVSVHPAALSRIIAALEQSQRIGVAGPLVSPGEELPFRPHPSPDWLSPPLRLDILPGVVASGWLPGALLLFKRACLESVLPFDERLFAYCEDVDICWRAWQQGWVVAAVLAARACESGRSLDQAACIYLNARNSLLVARWRGGRSISQGPFF